MTQEEYEINKNTGKDFDEFLCKIALDSGIVDTSGLDIPLEKSSIKYKTSHKTLYNSTNLAIEMLKVIAEENSYTIKQSDNDSSDFMARVKTIINKNLYFNERLPFLKNENNTIKIGSIKQSIKILTNSKDNNGTTWQNTTIKQLCSLTEGVNFNGNIVVKNKNHIYFHDSPVESSYSTPFGKIKHFFLTKNNVDKNEKLLEMVVKKYDLLGDNDVVKTFIESDLFGFMFTRELFYYINYLEIKDGKLIILYDHGISKLYTFDTQDICHKIINFEQLIECENEIMTCPIKYDYHERIFQLNKDIHDH